VGLFSIFSFFASRRCRALALCAALIAVLAACSPTFNWREVRPDGVALGFLLPCKPDKAEKTVPLGGRPVPMQLLGCDAGGATFAVAVADVGEAARIPAVLVEWQAATLANMRAGGTAPQIAPLKLAGAQQPVLVTAEGRRGDGSAVTGRAAYFARGTQVFQAVMYSAKPEPDAAETFFSSLKLD
jgi:hypothetical protein